MSQSCHDGGEKAPVPVSGKRVLLVGNPNVGKSVIFSHLTGKYVIVSNYPGTTVGISSGRGTFGVDCQVVDTPGVNSLVPRSEDERITRDILSEVGDKVVVQVADAKNLRRALLITSQLAEMELPCVLVLNMWDEAQQRGIRLNARRLSQILGIPVVPAVAVEKKGIAELKRKLKEAAKPSFRVKYDKEIEQAISRLEALLPALPLPRRAAALMLLSGDESFKKRVSLLLSQQEWRSIEEVIFQLQSRYARSLGYLITRRRLETAKALLTQVSSAGAQAAFSWSEALGRWSSHPLAGIPILFLVLFVFYKLVGQFAAGTLVDFMEEVVFGQYVNPWAASLFQLVPWTLLQELFVGKYGLITVGLTYAVAIILPIVLLFFLLFGIIEDGGYLPRLSIMANEFFKRIGLTGKAVLPMVLGLGCGTMAILTTRILDSRRDRIIATLLLALAIPCSAQLGVILAMLSGVSGQAVLLFLGILLLQLFLVGFLASKVIPGERSDFIQEIPPIRLPQLSNIFFKTLARVRWYFTEAVPLFLLGTFILFVLDKVGALAVLERGGAPVVRDWLGLPVEATSAFIMGFLRRDYGAAGLFALSQKGLLDTTQILVSLVTITLFVPCIAAFMVIMKERGWKVGLAVVGFIFPYALFMGGLLNLALRTLGVKL